MVDDTVQFAMESTKEIARKLREILLGPLIVPILHNAIKYCSH